MKYESLLLSLVVILLPMLPMLADSLNMELVGREPFGPANDVHVVNNYAYLCAGGTLVILDVSDPSQLTEVGRIDTPGLAWDVEVFRDYAYVADQEAGLRVINISDPKNPKEVGFYDTPGIARGVHVSDRYAYVADGKSGLRVIDISDPANPKEVGFYDTPDSADEVYVADGCAYVGKQVINISDPMNPRKVGDFDTPIRPFGFCVSDGYAYVVGSLRQSPAIKVMDVSDPQNPKEMGFWERDPADPAPMDYYWPDIIYAAGGYAYVGEDGSEGCAYRLRVVDISDPMKPRDVGYNGGNPYPKGIYASGGYVYLLHELCDPGLTVIDVTKPENPKEVGFYNTPENSARVCVAGGYAYVGMESECCEGCNTVGLRVIDISDPKKPEDVGFWNPPFCGATDEFDGHLDYLIEIFVVGDLIYMVGGDACAGGDNLVVLGISNPKEPRVIQSYKFERSNVVEVRGSHIADSYIYTVSDSYSYTGVHGFQVLGIPELEVVGLCDIPDYAKGVYVADGYACVAYDAGILVIDVSDPKSPKEVGFCGIPGHVGSIHIADGYAYVTMVTGNTTTLVMMDISDPKNLKEVVNLAHGEEAVHVAEGYVCVADDDVGIRVIDISNPDNSREAGFHRIPRAKGFCFADGYIYFAEDGAGLCILRFTGRN